MYEQRVKLQSARQRVPFDHYPTPSGLCLASLEWLRDECHPCPRVILDSSMGTGVWGAAARRIWPDATIIGVELQPLLWKSPAYDHVLDVCDFRRYAASAHAVGMPQPDMLIGNPPYHNNYPELFIRLGMRLLTAGGYMVHLFRSALMEGQERGESFWPFFMPRYRLTLARRPSFTRDGKTDATSYSLFIHQQGANPRFYQGGILRWDYEPEPWPEDEPLRTVAGLLVDDVDKHRLPPAIKTRGHHRSQLVMEGF